MTRYLDIIRPHRPSQPGRPPVASAPLAEPVRGGAAGAAATLYADTGRKGSGGRRAPGVEAVLAEMGRPGSGPAKALRTYLEKPNAERLGWLTKAVLRSLAINTDDWKRYAPVVEEAATKAGRYAGGQKEV